jgi:hypothetical protein
VPLQNFLRLLLLLGKVSLHWKLGEDRVVIWYKLFELGHVKDMMNLNAWWKLKLVRRTTNTFQHLVAANELVRELRERSSYHRCLGIWL